MFLENNKTFSAVYHMERFGYSQVSTNTEAVVEANARVQAKHHHNFDKVRKRRDVGEKMATIKDKFDLLSLILRCTFHCLTT